FKFPGEEFSLWWFSLIAEKSPGKTEAYENLISFLVGLRQKKSNLRLRERLCGYWLFVFLNGLHVFFCFLLQVCLIKLSLKDFKKRVTYLKLKRNIIVSYFPLFDKEKAIGGVFENKYLAPFHRLIAESYPDSYAHICLYVNFDEGGLLRAIAQLKCFGKREPVFFLEEFIKLSDIGKVLFYYLYFSVVSILNIRRVKKLFMYTYNDKQFNIWDFFRADYFNSFSGEALLYSLAYIFLFRRMVDHLNINSKVIVTAEMHEWEKALYVSTKKKGIVTIAYQHTHVPELLLNYFHDIEEIQGDDFISHCPLPDYLATVGSTTAELFLKYGWPKKRIFVWGAQRFESLKLLKERRSQKKGNFFVCAFSIIPSEAENVLILLAQAFPDYPGYKIVLKSHPLLNINIIARALRLQLNPEAFEFSEEGLEELTASAQGMIVTASSSCFYAIALGSQVIIPLFEGRLDLNPLSYVTDIPLYVYNAKELRGVCDSIMDKTAPSVSQDKFETVLNQYFYFPKDDSEYIEKIDGLQKVN
ncbi:MAG: hypothetical protein NTZ48_03665, partial [Candidatus Omnitrophica bacterium]|nr:hypothetical protein [Candidatus Omnitrophota bacterium]